MKRFRWLGLFCVAVGVVSACERPEYSYSDSVPVAGNTTPSFSGSASIPGSPTGTGAAPPVDQCRLFATVESVPIFRPQAISNQLPANKELYAQVTDDEAKALRQGGPLLVPQALGNLPPALNNLLTSLSQSLTNLERKALVVQLLERFKAARAAWPNPWALRLIDHPATEHMNAVRLRLAPNAWIARVIDGSPIVLDLDNSQVPLTDALQHPERIVAIYYVVGSDPAGVAAGTPCESGKREFAVGNPAMVESFELGTQDIASRLSADLDLLQRLFAAARLCNNVDDASGMTFHSATVCQAWDFFDPTTEYQAYQWALSNPVELYKPNPQNLGSLIQALQDDMSPPNPFVSASPLGEGGVSNAQGGAPGTGGADGAGEAGVGEGGR